MQHSSLGYDMEKLLEAVTAVVCLLSPEKIDALAARIRKNGDENVNVVLPDVVGTAAARAVVDRLVNAWRLTSVGSDELASMLLAASHALVNASRQQSIELVWTGPTTPFVSPRRTEQALLQVIRTAKRNLFVTSFVAYDVSTIVKALNDAGTRGVSISMLLESSQNQGGTITFDAIAHMKTLVPALRLYMWRDKTDPFFDGRVHAKVAVADGRMCFITSANLTGHAMEKNMEAGVLISGGAIPRVLEEHLCALITTNVIALV